MLNTVRETLFRPDVHQGGKTRPQPADFQTNVARSQGDRREMCDAQSSRLYQNNRSVIEDQHTDIKDDINQVSVSMSVFQNVISGHDLEHTHIENFYPKHGAITISRFSSVVINIVSMKRV